MHVSTALLALASVAIAAPYAPFPLADGFPSPNPAQLKKIQVAAGGALPNGGLPTKLSDAAAVAFQLISVQETFEVAYFNDLLYNITAGVPGYKLWGKERDFAIKTFTQIRNQEEIHAIGANAILANSKRPVPATCKYNFPVNDYLSAVSLAATFTDVVLSVLPVVQTQFALDAGQETGLIGLIGSIIAQEGEQDGWFRSVQGKVPSAAPFLTGSNPAFAFTALQSFLVPGSCDLSLIKKYIPTFAPLNALTAPTNKDTIITYSVPGKLPKGAAVAYLSGQLLPYVAKIQNARYSKGMTTFQAPFPFSTGSFSKGLTIGAVVSECKDFANAAEVAAASVFGPALLEVQ